MAKWMTLQRVMLTPAGERTPALFQAGSIVELPADAVPSSCLAAMCPEARAAKAKTLKSYGPEPRAYLQLWERRGRASLGRTPKRILEEAEAEMEGTPT